jgi:hypothetical protein
MAGYRDRLATHWSMALASACEQNGSKKNMPPAKQYPSCAVSIDMTTTTTTETNVGTSVAATRIAIRMAKLAERLQKNSK